MTVSCAACGRPYEAKTSRARYCSETCKKRGQRRATDAPVEPSPSLVDATRLELDAAGLLDTRMGQQAMALAAKVASGYDTGSALAAASKELDRLIDKAMASTAKTVSRVDEMKARRDAIRDRATAG